jgi:hypothetical protein
MPSLRCMSTHSFPQALARVALGSDPPHGYAPQIPCRYCSGLSQGGVLPLGLAGKTLACPLAEPCGFVPGHAVDRVFAVVRQATVATQG